MSNHSEHSIQNLLYKWKTIKKAKFKLSNVYMYHNWESDFFFVGSDYTTWELEIKISRSDYNRDFTHKFKKHDLLKQIYETNNENNYFVPVHFYYCAPKGIIKKDTLPEYAGLIEINDDNSLYFATEVRSLYKSQMTEENYSTLLENVNEGIYKKSLKDEREFINFKIKYEAAGTEAGRKIEFDKFIKKKRI